MVHLHIAQDPNARPEQLYEIFNMYYNKGSGELVLAHLAQNPNTPDDVIQKLYNMHKYGIYINLAWNPKLSSDMLAELANRHAKHSKSVIEVILENPNTDIQTLQQIRKNYAGYPDIVTRYNQIMAERGYDT